ncbi:NAD(P)-dependent oxidoreductase [Lacisediminihabitans sp. H27-G8]|uniref:NAD(P)-dependent oxidoreductase n=1 Tax=Lacisediminihabitans sp. H27-G8 TaxID=3111909 RepID=UPI0038FD23F9
MDISSPVQSVGFIGLGDQGAPMARAVAESPFHLRVWARRAASLGALHGRPHTAEASVRALAAESDIVLLVLRDDSDVEDVLFDKGLLASMQRGSIIVNHGTGDPETAVRFAELAELRGISVLDAPVSGGGPGAELRKLTTIVGGDAAAFERAQPVFETFSASTVYMGGPGSGQVAKLLNNALTMTNLKNAEDVLGMADSMGVNVAAFRHLLASSSGGSFVIQALGDQITPEIAPHLQALMVRDIEHFAEGVGRLGIDTSEVRDRGRAGAEGLIEVTELVERHLR